MPETTSLVDHPLLTTVGLFFEAHAGMARDSGRRLEDETGLSVQWFEVLLRLVRSPGHRLRMSDLAAQTTLSASGLTRAVDRMQASGLVRREACPTDRRSTYAVLTDEGEDRILRAIPVHVAHVSTLFGSIFDERELELFTSLVRRLRDATNPLAALASTPEALGAG